jgi:hypothetical protein
MGPNKWGQAPFIKKEDVLIQKMGPRKWGLAPFIPQASLSSPSKRNHARSAFLTVFSPYSLRQTRESGYLPKPFLIKEMEMITYQRHQN